MALMVEKKAPYFKGTAVIGGDATNMIPDTAYKEISIDDYKGKWVVLFFYPLDFTFICPTEIEAFGTSYPKFQELNCEVIACSTDSAASHLAWRQHQPSLTNLPYPMLADLTREISKAYDIYQEETGHTLRGLYIIDPEGTLQYALIHPDKVGRNPEETLRVLAALQTGEKTPCSWQPGQKTLG